MVTKSKIVILKNLVLLKLLYFLEILKQCLFKLRELKVAEIKKLGVEDLIDPQQVYT